MRRYTFFASHHKIHCRIDIFTPNKLQAYIKSVSTGQWIYFDHAPVVMAGTVERRSRRLYQWQLNNFLLDSTGLSLIELTPA